MDSKQFEIFLEDNRRSTAAAIKETVNGKIDGMRADLNAHMLRVEPVIKAYESNQVLKIAVDHAGDRIMYWAKVITAIGIIFGVFYAAFKLGVTQVITKP